MSLLDKLKKPFIVSAVSLGLLLGSVGCVSEEDILPIDENILFWRSTEEDAPKLFSVGMNEIETPIFSENIFSDTFQVLSKDNNRMVVIDYNVRAYEEEIGYAIKLIDLDPNNIETVLEGRSVHGILPLTFFRGDSRLLCALNPKNILHGWSSNNPTLLFSIDLETGGNTEKIEPLGELNPFAYFGENPLSQDGENLIYTLDLEGNSEIFIRNLASEQDIRITDSEGEEHSPFWFDDNSLLFERVDFRNSERSGVYLVDLLDEGINERLVLAGAKYPYTIPFSNNISFVLDGALCLYHLESGSVVDSVKLPKYHSSNFHWNDGGKYCSFTGGKKGNHLYVIDFESKTKVLLGEYSNSGIIEICGWIN